MKKPNIFPIENDGKIRDTLQKLRARNKKLEKENKELRSRLSTLEEAFRKTKAFLKDSTDEFSIEQCIEGAKKNQTLKELKPSCPKCSSKLSKIKTNNRDIVICGNKNCGFKEIQRNTETVCDS